MKKSLFWAAIEQTGPQAIGFITSVILARLLNPSDFGLVAMITVFMAVATLFADSGMSQALIQRKANSEDDKVSVFYLNIGIGFALTSLLVLTAPLIARFYERPLLTDVIRWQSLGFTISAFGIVHHTLLSRELLLNKTALASFISTVVGGLVSVGMALLEYGVWSLVGGYLAGTASRVLALWFVSSWRPVGSFSKNSVKEIWRYSFNLLAAGMFTTFVDNLSNLLIGKKYSAADLGLYNRAFNLYYLPVSLMTGVINRVAFPIFSRNQDNPENFKFELRRSVKSAALLAGFVSLLVALVADPLVPWLLGQSWTGSIVYLQILSLGGIFFPVNVLLITAIKSTGNSRSFLRVEIIKKFIIMAALLVAVQFSIEAMAWSLLGTGTIAFLLNSLFAIKETTYRWRELIYDLLPTVSILGMAAIITWVVKNLLPIQLDIIIMIITAAIFFSVILLLVYLFSSTYFKDIWEQVKTTTIFLKTKFIH